MRSRIREPLTVIGLFTLAGGIIGFDIGIWPWDDPMGLTLPVVIGVIAGFLVGVFIVWAVRQFESVT